MWEEANKSFSRSSLLTKLEEAQLNGFKGVKLFEMELMPGEPWRSTNNPAWLEQKLGLPSKSLTGNVHMVKEMSVLGAVTMVLLWSREEEARGPGGFVAGMMDLLEKKGGESQGTTFRMQTYRIAEGQEKTYVIQKGLRGSCDSFDYENWRDMASSDLGITIAPLVGGISGIRFHH
jgi:hypothetical protein